MPIKTRQLNRAILPVKEIQKAIQKLDKNSQMNVAVYISGVEEYILAEIIQKAIIVARMKGSTEISKTDLVEAIDGDSDLKELLGKHVEG
ncbi:hypothetical protein JTE90_005733 [Oedothorax gibbosus]|uniref:Histone H2A n=1 Tax=Oedothorax gibbosus TaxID=931172 RepID=A0AAV6TYZ0_9ARAC|nr:hypothetical protein JTE90_005733 [Oedothorax gibbosus]